MSVRELYMSISGTEPGPNGFVQVNYHEVGKAMEKLHKAGIVTAYTYNPPWQGDVVMRLAQAQEQPPEPEPVSEPKRKRKSKTST